MAAIDNLRKIDHIVVLMMENRSYDHMLGYLTLSGARPGLDGLKPGMQYSIPGEPNPVSIERQKSTAVRPDPCHEAACVDAQLANGMGGFAKNFKDVGGNPADVMNYYDAAQVPAYDLLAREFAVCDRWFSSVPGATWPNRLYAICGQAPSRDNQKIPQYYLPSFVRHLDELSVSWRWYAHEELGPTPISCIQLADGAYDTRRKSVFFDPHFFKDAREGKLPSVSWIDPNFTGFGEESGENDDHPPADITAGQALVQSVVQALGSSPCWETTLLVITYDEHGGFFDHVTPPAAAGRKPFDRYGVRVPAIVVSPWVGRGVDDHTLYDHTSIIRTILERFCRARDGSIPDMGVRVAKANHLGGLLANDAPRPALETNAFTALTVVKKRAGTATKDNDFQDGWKKAVAAIEKKRRAELATKSSSRTARGSRARASPRRRRRRSR